MTVLTENLIAGLKLQLDMMDDELEPGMALEDVPEYGETLRIISELRRLQDLEADNASLHQQFSDQDAIVTELRKTNADLRQQLEKADEIKRLRDAIKTEADYCFAWAANAEMIGDDDRANRHKQRAERLMEYLK